MLLKYGCGSCDSASALNIMKLISNNKQYVSTENKNMLIDGSTRHQTNVSSVLSNSLLPDYGGRLFLHCVCSSLWGCMPSRYRRQQCRDSRRHVQLHVVCLLSLSWTRIGSFQQTCTSPLSWRRTYVRSDVLWENYLQAHSVKAQWEGVHICVQLVAQGLGAGPVAVSPEETRRIAAAGICHCKHNRTYFTVAIPSITIQLLQFEPTNTHTVLLKPQYYSTPAATCFEPDWSTVREHTVVQKRCLKFSACRCRKQDTVIFMW